MKIEFDTDKVVGNVVKVSDNAFAFSKLVFVKSLKFSKKLNSCMKAAVVEFKKEEGENEC